MSTDEKKEEKLAFVFKKLSELLYTHFGEALHQPSEDYPHLWKQETLAYPIIHYIRKSNGFIMDALVQGFANEFFGIKVDQVRDIIYEINTQIVPLYSFLFEATEKDVNKLYLDKEAVEFIKHMETCKGDCDYEKHDKPE